MQRGVVIYETQWSLNHYIANQQVVVFSDIQATLEKDFPIAGVAGLLIVESGWTDDTTHRYVHQRYITRDNTREFYRMWNIDTWTNWLEKPTSNALNDCFQSVSDGKSLVAAAITDKGVTTASTATFQTMADNIINIASATNVATPVVSILKGRFNDDNCDPDDWQRGGSFSMSVSLAANSVYYVTFTGMDAVSGNTDTYPGTNWTFTMGALTCSATYETVDNIAMSYYMGAGIASKTYKITTTSDISISQAFSRSGHYNNVYFVVASIMKLV